MIEKQRDKQGILLKVKTNSSVSLEDMLQGLDILQKDDSLPRDLRILEDATGVEVKFTRKDIRTLITGITEVALNYHSIRHAVVQDSPKNTALALLLKHRNTSPNYSIAVFSTLKAAKHWLEYGES